MVWPWNRSKTPLRTDSGQLRDIQVRMAEMEADFEKVFHLIDKINGRLRQRERRADLDGDRGAAEGGGDGGDDRPEFVAPLQAEGAGPSSSSLTLPVYSKEQLRQFARQRGLGS